MTKLVDSEDQEVETGEFAWILTSTKLSNRSTCNRAGVSCNIPDSDDSCCVHGMCGELAFEVD